MTFNVILEQCKGVHCVDLGESFQTHIYLQNLASIQPRTSPPKFAASRDPARAAVEGGGRRTYAAMALDGLDRARSRLYRSQILQVNMRLKALAEIYTMHSFALL